MKEIILLIAMLFVIGTSYSYAQTARTANNTKELVVGHKNVKTDDMMRTVNTPAQVLPTFVGTMKKTGEVAKSTNIGSISTPTVLTGGSTASKTVGNNVNGTSGATLKKSTIAIKSKKISSLTKGQQPKK